MLTKRVVTKEIDSSSIFTAAHFILKHYSNRILIPESSGKKRKIHILGNYYVIIGIDPCPPYSSNHHFRKNNTNGQTRHKCKALV